MSVEQLFEKVELDGRYYWKIFRGRGVDKKHLVCENTQIENKEESLGLLQQQVSYLSPGTYNVVTRMTANDPNGLSNLIQISGGAAMGSPAIGNPMMGFPAMGSQFMQMFQFFDQMNSQKIAAALQQKELEFKIQRLEEELDAPPGSPKEVMLHTLAANADKIVDRTFALLGIPNTPTAAAPVQGSLGNTQSQPQAQNIQMDLNVVFGCLAQLQQLYPQYPIDQLLSRIILFAQTNKDTLDGLVQMLFADDTSQ